MRQFKKGDETVMDVVFGRIQVSVPHIPWARTKSLNHRGWSLSMLPIPVLVIIILCHC